MKHASHGGQVTRDDSATEYVKREIEAADHDLVRARDSLGDGDFKWATIQAYYVGFHSIRALLFSRSYRERSHYCLIQAIYALFVDEGLLESSLLRHLEIVKSLREKADYASDFSAAGAERSLAVAHTLLDRAKSLCGMPLP